MFMFIVFHMVPTATREYRTLAGAGLEAGGPLSGGGM